MAVKITLLGAIALVALTGEGWCADFPVKATPSALYDWTGFYLGAHVGWGFAETQGLTNNNASEIIFNGGNNIAVPFLPDNSPTDQTIRGWLAGGQLGYNHQFGRTVVGFELSGTWSNLNGQSAGASPGALLVTGSTPTSLGCSQLLQVSAGGASVSVACSAKVDWTAQALVRIGRTFGDNRFLPYIEGGLAFAHLSIATSINELIGVTATDSFGRSSVLPGAVLGGGAQYALGNGFSIGAEYLYARYPSQDFSSTGIATCVPGCGTPVQTLIVHTAQENRDLSSSTIRAVLNYRLAD